MEKQQKQIKFLRKKLANCYELQKNFGVLQKK